MNQAGSQLVKRRPWQDLYKIESYYRKGAGQVVIRERKRKIIEAGHFPLGDRPWGFIMQIISPGITGIFQTDWFRIPLQGMEETAVKLDIKSWWYFVQVAPFWAAYFIFNISDWKTNKVIEQFTRINVF